ncbi:MAG: CZB domain-containing protein, partial [Sedimentisphaerales bacterium]|nr:CZB domain-containing protein [Sedimentisphaerales bacterium]
MFKNMTIGKKIALGFCVVLILLIVVATLSFRGVTSLGTDAKEVVGKNELIENLTRKEVDHLKWAAAVSELLTNEHVTELSVQTDPTKCAFGQWYYSDARKEAEHAVPSLAPLMKEIEHYHNTLHTSAIEIGNHFHQADESLPGILAGRQVDHLKWADTIRDAFLADAESVNVQTDPVKCALGVWLQSEQAQKAYQSGTSEFRQTWDKMLATHRHLHESAVEICSNFGQGEQGKQTAKQIFEEKTIPLLHGTLQELETLKSTSESALTGMKKASEVFVTQTKPSLLKVQELLGKSCEEVKTIVKDTNEGMLSSAATTKVAVGIISIIALGIGVALAFLIGRQIVRALTRIINALTEGAEQVASASGQVSAASQSLAEGATEQAAGLEETSSSL